MSEKTVTAILAALDKGFRVELTKRKDGSLEIRTVTRKALKV